MTVYVDRMMGGQRSVAHLVADTHDELMAMAQRLGLQPEWIQRPGTAREHFDLVLSKRAAAIDAGAQPVSSREMARVTLRKRHGAGPDQDAREGATA